MLHLTPPPHFDPHPRHVASCFVEHKGHVLFLLRQDHKIEGNTWCLPGGKTETNETPLQAVIREVEEETTLILTESDLESLHSYYLEYSYGHIVYHVFRATLTSKPTITIRPDEHKDYRWISPHAAQHELDLIIDLAPIIDILHPKK